MKAPHCKNCGSADIYERKHPPPSKPSRSWYCVNCYRRWTARRILHPGNPRGNRRADRERSVAQMMFDPAWGPHGR
jgi:hypothetical protein